MSDTLQPHGLKHARLPYPLPSPRLCSNAVITFSLTSHHPPPTGWALIPLRRIVQPGQRHTGLNQLWVQILAHPLSSHLNLNTLFSVYAIVFQWLSHVWFFVTPWTAAHQASLFFIISQSLLKFTSNWGSDVIQQTHPLSPPSLPALNLSQHQGLFQWVGFHIRWTKYWSFSFSISPSNEYSGLISFRIDWFDLLAVQETLKRLLQYHSSKASILQCSAFFMVQLSHPYMTTGKTIALTRWMELCQQSGVANF